MFLILPVSFFSPHFFDLFSPSFLLCATAFSSLLSSFSLAAAFIISLHFFVSSSIFLCSSSLFCSSQEIWELDDGVVLTAPARD
jgi:hypothetical protein